MQLGSTTCCSATAEGRILWKKGLFLPDAGGIHGLMPAEMDKNPQIFHFSAPPLNPGFFCNSQEDANGTDEAETWHTQTPLPITPTSQPLPRGSNTQDGLGSNVTEVGHFLRENVGILPVTISLWTPAKESPVVLGAAGAGEAGPAALCVPWSTGAAQEQLRAFLGMQRKRETRQGWSAWKGNVERENPPPSQGGWAGWERCHGSSPFQPLHPASIPRSQGCTGRFRDAPAPSCPSLQAPGMHLLPKSLALREVRRC